MKIVYFNYLYDLYGVSLGSTRKAELLMAELEKSGYDVKIYWLEKQPTGNASLKHRIYGFFKKYMSGMVHNPKRLLSNIPNFFKEYRILKNENPDLLIYRLHSYFFSGLLAAKLLKIPVIIEADTPNIYEDMVFQPKIWHLPLIGCYIEKCVIQNAKMTICVSNDAKNYFIDKGIPEYKIAVITNGADTNKFGPFIDDDLIRQKYRITNRICIGFIGSFHFWHGVENLFKIIKSIVNSNPGAVFMMVGDGGPLKQTFETYVREENLENNVIFTGYIPYKEIPLYLAAMDVVLAPYPKLNFFYYSPIKIFEYMAAGKTVITSRIGQTAEIIQDGVNGLLSEPGNIEEMIKKLSDIIKSPELRLTIGENARNTIKNEHTWQKKAEQWHKICKKAVQQKQNNHNPSIINLLQLVNGFAIGGGELKLLELVKTLIEKYPNKYNQIICSVGQGGPLQEEFEKLGVKVVIFPKRHRFDISLILKVARLMIKEKIDIVQTTLFYADVIGAFAAKLAKVPTVISWEVVTQPLVNRHKLIYNLAKRNIDYVVTVSNATKNQVIKERNLNPQKVITIHYGIDLKKFQKKNCDSKRAELKIGKNEKIVGTVARLTEQKGHVFLIDAATSIIKQFSNVKFIFVGDGPLKKQLEAKVVEMEISSNFIFLGFRRDIRELLSVFNIFVLPSLYEGLPNVVLEAMACSHPLVATRVDGTPELVVDGVTGLLVPPKDSNSLAQAITYLLKNENSISEMGQQGRKRVENLFSLEKQIEHFNNLYSTLHIRRQEI
ncbi:MAG: glycosyltransferase [Ignavibacteriales bacterium]|nr:glycosyltransferase [Ignavibacteriales bacterium]